MSWGSLKFIDSSASLTESLDKVHDYVLMIITSVLIMVLILLFYLFFLKSFYLGFLEEESLEFIWTLVPFVVIIFLIFPSISALYLLDSCSLCGLNLSVIGHQWYWSYFYKDFGSFYLDSYMVPLFDTMIPNLDVDNRLLVPTSLPIRCFLTSADVLHSWAVPSLGVKMDAVPGRVNQFCFCAKHSGLYFGQCSEICGINHSFMPIMLEVGAFDDCFLL